ncbi:serine/arginine-rich SC35-like splicing factor SCL30A [Histomonas meleagridis]|uniref:serine/arginine-rich SC35-like splicing factor SCL30A n=1 Tax=Histomonas meleagridis TaxID=135588 RepID=UPI0035597585|nr:serine/arginine-rich SC35-like splicing factor SCL30A [Histomonas meleagridis]KAH0803121.1 serine/arginine-rich SC35-like splicing factor SCL30A [Histomonas meleagridis]
MSDTFLALVILIKKWYIYTMSSGSENASPPPEDKPDTNKDEDPPQNYCLYVGNINYKTTEEQLKERFSQIGTISNVQIPTHRGASAGYAFVDVPDKEVALKIIDELNKTEFDGRRITVEFSEKNGDRRRSRRRSRYHDDRRHERRHSYDDYYSPPPRRSRDRYHDDYSRSRRSRGGYDDYSPPPRRSYDYDDYSPPPRRSRDRRSSPPRRSRGRYSDRR